jgi:hypothetical protein
MATLQYEFEPLGRSPEDGFNDPLKTIFGQDVETVIREAFQNSIDAVLDPTKPVVVKVSLETLSRSDIPNIEQLEKILKACSENKTGKRHFLNALNVLRSGKIPTLVISDFNTTGLSGSDNDESGKYYNFFKSVGGNNKPPGSAGSYGYGKSTNIAFSEIDTFFATSKHEAGDGPVGHLFMGCIRVCSHMTKNVKKRGVGSFGMPGQLPVRDPLLIPKPFFLDHRRDNFGTDIFIPAYKDRDAWKLNTIKSALKNFWLAVMEGKLQLQVDDVQINNETIDNVMRAYFPETSRSGSAWRKDDPVPYFETYKNASRIEAKLPTLGNVESYFLSGDEKNTTGYVACFRKNLMLIQHKSFRSIVPFTGVFICSDDDGNVILQKMEPPQHEKWDPHVLHAQDENGKPLHECSKADKEYKEFLRSEIKKMLGTESSRRFDLSSVDQYISIINNEKQSTGSVNQNEASEPSETQTSIEKIKRRESAFKPIRKAATFTAMAEAQEGGETLAIGEGELGTPPGPGGESKTPPDPGAPPVSSTDVDSGETEKKARIVKANFRAIPVNEDGELKTELIIRTKPARPNRTFNIHFKAGTDEDALPLPITSVAPQGRVDTKGNVVNVISDNNGEIRVKVIFVQNRVYAVKINLYEHI